MAFCFFLLFLVVGAIGNETETTFDQGNEDQIQHGVEAELDSDNIFDNFDPSHILTFPINRRSKEIFVKEITSSTQVRGTWIVLEGDDHRLDFRIIDPSGSILLSQIKQKEGIFELTFESEGTYIFEFDNSGVLKGDKVVTFAIENLTEEEEEDIIDDEIVLNPKLSGFISSIHKLNKMLSNIENEQMFLELRERSHRDLQEATCSQIAWLTVLENILIIVVCFSQAIYIRKLINFRPML